MKITVTNHGGENPYATCNCGSNASGNQGSKCRAYPEPAERATCANSSGPSAPVAPLS